MKNISKILISAVLLTNLIFSVTIAQPIEKQINDSQNTITRFSGNQGGASGPGDTDGWD